MIKTNKKTLEETSNFSIFPTFNNTDECSVDGELENSINRKLALKAIFTDYQPVYDDGSGTFVCQLMKSTVTVGTKTFDCYPVHIYATWSYLIPLMKCAYDEDPTRDSAKNTFAVKIPMNATRMVLNSYTC